MDEPVADGPATPVRVQLTDREKRWVWVAGLAPMPVVVLLLTPFALLGDASPFDLVGAALVYGGLTGMAAAVVAFDRLQTRHCPRCGDGARRGEHRCATCGYDLAERPRWACEERHRLHLEPGLCQCGRRLLELPSARGLGREVTRMLWFGLWLLAVLLAVGIGLRIMA